MRRITSIILAITFIVVSVTGIQMDNVQDRLKAADNSPMIQQQIVDSNNSGIIMIVSAGKLFYPREAHKIAGYLFIITGLVHLKINIRSLLFYLKRKR
ncbi:MAG TPA: hypothetical protein VN426_10295 [Syntrophomonadaceae bacterium]|nr:hypothetical protein [Syntrophomonadaceae bacterium]